MGGAFTAIADDSSAPLYNPAGIVQIRWNEMSAMYAQLFSGLTLYSGNQTTGGDTLHLGQNSLAFVARPTRWGSFAVSWTNFNAEPLYREDMATLTYARSLGDVLPAFDNALSVGVNARYLRRAFTLDAATSNDAVFNAGSSVQSVTADVGILWKPVDGAWRGWRVGLWGRT